MEYRNVENIMELIPWKKEEEELYVRKSTWHHDLPFLVDDTADKAEMLLFHAAGHDAQLVVFPEAFIGGYPRGSTFGVSIGNQTNKGKEDFRKYHASAIDVPCEVDRLAAAAGKYKVYVVIGVIERDGHTLYSTVLFFNSQGAAIRWENRMPPLRTAMCAKGIEIYCAPTADDRDVGLASMTHIALEGGCFVLSAHQCCRRKDYPPAPEYVFSGTEEDLTPDSIVCDGGSVIILPSGVVLPGPLNGMEGFVFANLDLKLLA